MWMVLGLALAIAEAHIPMNFFLLAFGLGGLVVGALTGLGWGGPPWLQWLGFTVLSVATAVVLNRTLARSSATRFDRIRELDNLVGETAVVSEDIAQNGVGRAELRGTPWTARGDGGQALARGTRCRVARVEGLTIWLRPE